MAADGGRLANLVATLAVTLADRIRADTEDAAGHAAAAPAALVALKEFLERPSIDDLRAVVGLTHSGTVRLVERMAEAGLVARRPGRDGRSVAIVLTPKGRKTAERIAAARFAAVSPALDTLSDDDRDVLAVHLEKMLAAVTAERLVARSRGEHLAGGWMCRLCDFGACGRDRGACPVGNAAAVATATPSSNQSRAGGRGVS
jgi:DNA-binding MarR family transcriptional regulator